MGHLHLNGMGSSQVFSLPFLFKCQCKGLVARARDDAGGLQALLVQVFKLLYDGVRRDITPCYATHPIKHIVFT